MSKSQKNASTRKPIGKKVRFEIFKRDNFQCQYCGRYAPEVILEIDHITPVKHKGKTETINMVTACFDCNHGKGARELSDSQILEQQREQLNKLNERKEQMQMLIQWKRELLKLENTQINEIEQIVLKPYNRSLTETGQTKIRKTIKKYGFSEVYESAQISLSNYLNKKDNDDFNKIIDYIPRICANRVRAISDPLFPRKAYLLGILKNRFIYPPYELFTLRDYINAKITNFDDCEEAISVAQSVDTKNDFIYFMTSKYEVNNG